MELNLVKYEDEIQVVGKHNNFYVDYIRIVENYNYYKTSINLLTTGTMVILCNNKL